MALDNATVLEAVLTSAGMVVGCDPATTTPTFNTTRIYTAEDSTYGLYHAQGWPAKEKKANKLPETDQQPLIMARTFPK